jgi:hypothetical protein
MRSDHCGLRTLQFHSRQSAPERHQTAEKVFMAATFVCPVATFGNSDSMSSAFAVEDDAFIV